MRTHLIAAFAICFQGAAPAAAADWLTAPSYYTHDWSKGERVAQHSPIGPYYYYNRPDYLKSGYRQYRSTIELGNSADNLHIVEEWGAPVRPYEEWQYPFRPYSVPYGAWGPPFGGLGGGVGPYPYGGGFGGGGGFGPGGFGGAGGLGHGGFNQPAVNFAQPWLDGHHPQYNFNDRSDYWKPYTAPTPFGGPRHPGPHPGPGPKPGPGPGPGPHPPMGP